MAAKKKILDNAAEPMATKKNVVPIGFFIVNRKVPGVVASDHAFNRELTTKRNSISNGLSANPDPDNGEEPIILGQQLPNPYTVDNMQAAVNILYGGNFPISVSHLYVRFKPSSSEQLMTLDETEDLELQDYPIDYELIQEGDFYQDPTLGTEDFHWLYTVVPANYNFPLGIQHEVLEQLYLPENNEILKDLAESMMAGAQYSSERINNLSFVKINREDVLVESFNYTPECPCEPDVPCPVWPDCEQGGGGTPPPTLPSGIYVEEQTVCNQPTRILPLRQVNVVAKRWFKFWRGYTDNNGKFTITKNFRNEVKVIVKTKNSNARVSKVRGIRLWQMLFPCRKRVGVFNGSDLPSIRYVFTKPTDGSAHNKELAFWTAATTHNSIIEFRDYTTEFGLTQPPTNLHVMVTNWGFMENAGAAPLWNKCNNNTLPAVFATFFIANSNFVLAGVSVLTTVLKNQIDMIIGYKSTDYNCFLTSSQLRSVVYHELGHAQHYSQVGCNFWAQYRNAIVTELSKLDQINFHPYGTGNDQTTAPILATGEMWGNHIEKWYGEWHYGNGGAVAANFFSRLQGLEFFNDASSGLNANLWSIENFNPRINQLFGIPVDPHQWIPQGLPYDLLDNRNDFGTNPALPVDNVLGYTVQQCFNALQADVRSVPAFRDRLLQQNGNNQAAAVNDLFFRYGY